jgi:PD-(D/E)XK nuclease superfamily
VVTWVDGFSIVVALWGGLINASSRPVLTEAPAGRSDVSMTDWAGISADLDALRASGRWISGPTTMLEIIGRTRSEAPHEKLIAWLLDPLATHGLGSAVLAALIARLEGDRAPSPEQLIRARVRTQVVRASSRPDIVVTMPGKRLVIELKIDAKEGDKQTTQQANDYANDPGAQFVYLTLRDLPPNDPRFEHLLLRDLYGFLRPALETAPSPVFPAHMRGRSVAEDYAATLERMLGLDRIDQEAARYWFRHESEIWQAAEAARQLLTHLPERTKQKLAVLAPEFGDGIHIAAFTYLAVVTGSPERAVLMTREPWMLGAETARLGVGLGLATDPRTDKAGTNRYRPFWGVFALEEQVRNTLRERLSRVPDLPDSDQPQWDPWAVWWYVSLEPSDENDDLLAYYASSIAAQVGQFWQSHVGRLDHVVRPAST